MQKVEMQNEPFFPMKRMSLLDQVKENKKKDNINKQASKMKAKRR